MRYKFISDSVVARIDDDGVSRMSCNVEDAAYLAWRSAGNVTSPADPVPDPTPLEKIQAIEAANPFTHRTLRELSIAVGQLAAIATGGNIADNPAMRKLAEIQTLVAPLEADIEELAVDVRGKP